MTQLPRDFKEFLQLLNSKEVDYLLVGSYAVGYYRVKVEVEDLTPIGSPNLPAFGITRTYVANLTSDEVSSFLPDFSVIQEKSKTGSTRDLNFIFYKKHQVQASFSFDYGSGGATSFFDAPSLTLGDTSLHLTTVQLLRQFVAKHPKMVQALLLSGIQPQDIRP